MQPKPNSQTISSTITMHEMHVSARLSSGLICLLLLGQSASALSWGRRDAPMIRRRSDERHAVLGSVVLHGSQYKAVAGHAEGKRMLGCRTSKSSVVAAPQPRSRCPL